MQLTFLLLSAGLQAALHTFAFALSLRCFASGQLDGVHGWQWSAMAGIQLLCVLLGWHGMRYAVGWRKRRSQRVHPQVLAERQRIAQDLHDGVGSHLFQALALLNAQPVDYGPVRISLEYAMWRLRVEMQALDDVDASLLELLAATRWRLQPLLDARGIAMQWDIAVQDTDHSPRGARGKDLALLAQEAMSNALQHGACHTLKVHLQEQPNGAWQLEVADDGKGFEVSAVANATAQPCSKRGCGLRNMHARAKRAGAQLRIESTRGSGTWVRVQWD